MTVRSLSTAWLFLPVFYVTAGDQEAKKLPTQTVKISNTSVWKSLSAQLVAEGRGVLTIDGEFDLGKESDAKKTKVQVIVPNPGSEEKQALVETDKGRGKFSLRLGREGGPNFSYGGYEVHVFLFHEGKELVHQILHLSKMEPAILRPILKADPKHKLELEDSTISFDAGSPSSGKTGMTYFIKGTGTYDPGKDIAGFNCSVVAVTLRAEDKNMQTYNGISVYGNGIWSAQLTNIQPGDYTVWVEIDVNNNQPGCTDSLSKKVPLTVQK